MRQVVAERAGGPEVLHVVDAAVPEPGPGEVLIAAEAVGVNFTDVWARLASKASRPTARHRGRRHGGRRRPGRHRASHRDPVAATPYAISSTSAELVNAPVDLCFPLPAGMPATTGAALPLNYLTAYAAVEHAARPRAGERVLVHAAAGGVGSRRGAARPPARCGALCDRVTEQA